MVSIGNKAKLVTSEQCMSCGKCCKEFNMSSDVDTGLRFLWTDTDIIEAEDTPFYLYPNMRETRVRFKCRCSMLQECDGKFKCKVWDKERPDFCNTYPDHCFWHVPSWNREHIQKILDFEKVNCPGLESVSVDKVVEMLKSHRGE